MIALGFDSYKRNLNIHWKYLENTYVHVHLFS